MASITPKPIVECNVEGLEKIYYVDQSTPCVILAFNNQVDADSTRKKIVEAVKFTCLFSTPGPSYGGSESAQKLPYTLDVLRCDSQVKGEENRYTWGVAAKQGPSGVVVWTQTVDELIQRILANIDVPNGTSRKIDVIKVDSSQLYFKW